MPTAILHGLRALSPSGPLASRSGHLPLPLLRLYCAFLERLFSPAISNEAQRSRPWGPRIIALILVSLAVYLVARANWEVSHG